VEVLVALVLAGIVGTVLSRLLVGSQRVYRDQSQRIAVSESSRSALAILASEFRALSAGDGDLREIGADALTYNAMQGVYFLCARPDTAALEIRLDAAAAHRWRPITVGSDSVRLYAEREPATRTDDGWVSAIVVGSAVDTACPGARASLELRLAGISAAALAEVAVGAPVHAFRPMRIVRYRGGDGAWWLGLREYVASTATWAATQPIAGPLSATGLRFRYLDAEGNSTTNASEVVRIGIVVESRSPEAVHRDGSLGATHLLLGLRTEVTLRNNPIY
jgi:type II secretory pathway pseudopilin PulG